MMIERIKARGMFSLLLVVLSGPAAAAAANPVLRAGISVEERSLEAYTFDISRTGFSSILSDKAGFCLGAVGGSGAGAAPCTGKPDQQWRFYQALEGLYMVMNQEGMCLGYDIASHEDEPSVTVEDCHVGGDNDDTYWYTDKMGRFVNYGTSETKRGVALCFDWSAGDTAFLTNCDKVSNTFLTVNPEDAVQAATVVRAKKSATTTPDTVSPVAAPGPAPGGSVPAAVPLPPKASIGGTSAASPGGSGPAPAPLPLKARARANTAPRKKVPLGGTASGDPHFTSWGGKIKFDFHGGCDLILVQNAAFRKGLGLHIHIRTKIKTWWSFIEAAVLKIGDDTLEVMGDETGEARYWINGNQDKDGFLSGFKVHSRRINNHQTRFRIDLGQGDAISIETFKSFVRVNVHAVNSDTFHNAVGLMGRYPDGNLVGRDGITIMDKDVTSFGKQWKVLATEPQLFRHTSFMSECMMPSEKTSEQRQRRLGESTITREAAEQACSHASDMDHDACIFDVLATNDKDMAGSY